MTTQPGAPPSDPGGQAALQRAAVVLRSFGQPNSVVRQFDLWDDS
jgi:hypothetical protein